MIFLNENEVITQEINLSDFGIRNHSLFIRREDLIHPSVSGNKFRKLKYNVIRAQNEGKNLLLTFGGAYSNHIAATAAAGKEMGFKTVGIIRGEELIDKIKSNPTLSFARNCGMQLAFVSRELYRYKEDESYIKELKEDYGDFYMIPEGGTNSLAVRGCAEILMAEDAVYDYICTAVGTGGTLAGLVKGSYQHQMVLGFSALKGTFQTKTVPRYTNKMNYEITDSYCFEGYGKIDIDLVRFINEFKRKTKILLDPVYTGKMLYGIFDRLRNGFFTENSCILAVHTGGVQGVAGINQLLKRKNLPLIE